MDKAVNSHKVDKLVVDDTEFVLNRAYKNGAKAMRNSTPWNCNPHRPGTYAHDQWDNGHTNESAKLHVVAGIDVISANPIGITYRVTT